MRELAAPIPACTLIADKGLWGREYERRSAARESRSSLPSASASASGLARERRLAGLRLVIESTFSNLKRQMRLEQHLAKTPPGSCNGSPNDCSR